MAHHQIECWWLQKATATDLVRCTLLVDSKKITILSKDVLPISVEEIAELRTELWTDTWINAKSILGELIQKVNIPENECNYCSIVYKPTQRVLPGKTVDLIVTDREAMEILDNFLGKMICDYERSQLEYKNGQIDNTKVQIVDQLFGEYSEGGLLSISKLGEFIFKKQKIRKNIAECELLTVGCDKSESGFLTLKGFRQLFNSKHFGLFNSAHQDPMNQPMTNYFVASSHNSYLTGGQWLDKSSCEMYRNILLDGCRCIEIDVFYRNGRLTVMHGGTGTSEIALEDVLHTIQKYAYVKSNYPLIISIENHLPDHEDEMAQMLRRILADQLYTAQISKNVHKFAQLNTMEGRIFVKCSRALPTDTLKKPTEMVMKTISKFVPDMVSDHPIGAEEEAAEKEGKVMIERENNGDLGYEDSDNDENSSDDGENEYEKDEYENEETEEENEEFKKDTIVDSNLMVSDCFESLFAKKKPVKKREFLELLNYFEAKHFESIDELDNRDKFKFHHMISISEKKSKKHWMDTEDRLKYREFTKTHMARVYPSPIRANDPFAPSLNYRPIGHWNAGAQMVSLNYQTAMSEMAINWALFALNNGCGYVLKPRYLLDKSVQPVSKNLRIQILGGNFGDLFKGEEAINLTVTTRVYAAEDDNNIRRTHWKQEQKTNGKITNSINPVWNDFMSYKLSNPELSFVQFSLKNFDKYVGHYMISYKAMQNGYRWFDLVDKKYLPLSFARIYVHVDKEF